MADEAKKNYDEDVSKKSSTGMDPKVANLIAYLFSWLGGLIVWLIEKENRFVKWNALQALILGVIDMIIVVFFFGIFGWTSIFIGPVFQAIGGIVLIASWVFKIVCIVMGFQGKTYRIIWVAKLADKWFKM